MGDAEYMHAFHKIVMPVANEFNPDLVIGKKKNSVNTCSVVFFHRIL
jgi:hypothetical protein